MWWPWSMLITAIVGSFATAWVCKETGRDPRLGGILGLLAGIFGWLSLVSLWTYLYLNRLNPRVVKKPTKWYAWWR